KLLRAALPTPQSFEPLPLAAPPPRFEPGDADTRFVAAAATASQHVPPKRSWREVASALGLFVLLVGASAAMAQLMGVLLFR
ncbi:MAG: hypothetical protein K0S65_4921, partial [Labilithrix sp.]|nr:hypothetical protein [Labilithrix sp.]